MSRRYNPQLAKIHYSYTMSEAADLFKVHKNTVRAWMFDGLPFNDDSRPFLICGSELRAYLRRKYQKSKRPCKDNQMYCLKCRQPRKALGNMADYIPMSDEKGRLNALCDCCGSDMNKFAVFSKIDEIRNNFDVSIREVNNT